MDTIEKLSKLVEFKDVFGWFLSAGGPDAEERIASVLHKIDGLLMEFENYSEKDYTMLSAAQQRFSQLGIHKRGIELLAPKSKKLHLKGTGLIQHVSAELTELGSTPVLQETWHSAFEFFVESLRYLSMFSVFLFSIYVNSLTT